MGREFTRRSVLGALAALGTVGPAHALAPTASLHPRARAEDFGKFASGGLEGLVGRFDLSGQVACAVADAQSGLRLEGLDAQQALPPASVAKALTALYALDTLGAQYRFKTRVLAAGTLSGGVLNGDLILAGGADPTLDTNALVELVQQLQAAGVQKVTGKFKVYDGMLPYVRSIDPEQPEHLGYSPAVSGISLNFNRVHFEWRKAGQGYSVAMDARSDKYRPNVAMATMQVRRRNVPIYTYESTERLDQWTVASGALGNGGSRWLPVRKPALYAGDVFQTLARSRGIALSRVQVIRSLPAGTRELAVWRSDPLPEVLTGMLKYSNNLTAEMVGMTATVARGAKPADLAGSAARMNAWAAQVLGMTSTRMVDHSGLGSASRMTPDDLVGALVKVRQDGRLRPLLKTFPLRDANGRIYKDHPIKVDAKTGTLNFVSGLGGYMTAPDGTELAFAIFAADTARRRQITKSDREQPAGAGRWNKRAKQLQQKLIERWGAVYGS